MTISLCLLFQCSFHKCSRVVASNLEAVQRFTREHGNPGTVFPCYYAPNSPDYAILEVISVTLVSIHSCSCAVLKVISITCMHCCYCPPRTSDPVKLGLFNAKLHNENSCYIHRPICQLNEQDLLCHSV